MTAVKLAARVSGTCVLYTLVVAVAVPGSALGQTASPEADQIEEIVVTGSRIKRRDFSSTSPISSIDNEILSFSGQPTLEAALNQMPQVQPDFDRTANNPGNGTSRLNLRGLGSDRTLVMLNGRRLAPSGVGSSIDVNNLPQSLIDRVEIITGGASTVYGSDAIAGVVNFITRDDFDGFNLDASMYLTEHGDSQTSDLNIAYGHNFAGARGNITFFAGVLDREATLAGARAISAITWQDDWEGNLAPGGNFTTPSGVVFSPPVDLGNGPVFITFDSNGVPVEFIDPDDRYDFAPLNYLQTPLRRYNGGLFLNYAFSDRIETYFEITHTKNEALASLAEVPATSVYEINPDNPVLSPEAQQIFAAQFSPAGPNTVSFRYSRRMSELGPRIIGYERNYSRLVAGLRGDINDNWDYDIWLTYTDGDEQELFMNDASLSRLQQGLLVDPATGECFDPSNACVPLNLFGAGNLSAEGAAFVRLPPFVNTTSREQKMLSAFVRGTPLSTWAGPVDTAFGIEWRDDSGVFVADDALFTGDGAGFAAASGINGRERVSEIYAEAIVPLAQDARFAQYLALELGARYSSYDKAGAVDSFKLGADWQPIDSLRFRTMFQRSVRAPNLAEAFEEQFFEQSSFVGSDSRFDPCSASNDPAGNGNAEKCILQGMPADQIGVFEATPGFPAEYSFGGNPALVPEEAETFTAGVVLNFGALPNWQFAIDYFDLRVTDTIGEIDPADICFDPRNTASLFCDNIRREPVSYNVFEVFSVTSNRGKSETSGVDMQIDYQSDLPAWMAIGDGYASLDVGVIWTHLLSKTTQDNPVSTPLDCKGRFGWPCTDDLSGATFPDNRITGNIRYMSGDVSVHLTWRWIDGTANGAPLRSAQFGFPNPILQIPSIDSRSLVDLGIGYAFSDRVSARFNIANVFDRDPPFMADANTNNTDTTMYDVFGRSYSLSLSMHY